MHRAAAHPLVTVFVLALCIRLINLALLSGDDAFFAESDAPLYWLIGAKMAAPGGVAATLLEVTDRMPLYPLLLGAMRSAFGDAPRLVAVIQAVIDAGTCALIAALANEVSGQRGHPIGARAGHSPEVGSSARAALGALVSPRVGLIAGILAALSMTLIVFSSQILTETLFLFFFTSMLLAGAHFLRSPTLGLAPACWRRRGACARHAARLRPAAGGSGAGRLRRRAGPPARIRRRARRCRIVRGGRSGARYARTGAQCSPLRTLQPDLAGRRSPRLLDRSAGDAARRRHALSGHPGPDAGSLSAGAGGARSSPRHESLRYLGDKDRNRAR